MLGILKKIFGTAQDRQVKRYRAIVADVNRWDEKFQSLSDEELRGKTAEFKKRLADGESLDTLLPEAYGVVKQACRRMCGTDVHVSGYDQKWDMVPYDVQILGGIAMHHGSIAEMMTGEGKTLTATMPLYLNALTGKPVHLVTVNDYLVTRDCQWVGSIIRWLGLTTGALTNSTPNPERRQVYAADVVYGTASEFGFDYLRDNSVASRAEQQVQRGYYFAIVDEIDSTLIDEARTPLIISGPVPDSRQMYAELKGGVETLVRKQRDLCNRWATEARKTLEKAGALEEGGTTKLDKEGQEALRKLWRISKGAPRNKVLKRVRENPDLRAQIDALETFYVADSNKKEKERELAELLVLIDEKGSMHELTDRGIQAWVDYAGGSPDDFVMLDLGHEYHEIETNDELSADEKIEKKLAIREEDATRKERSHNLRQLLRAHLLMERDVDYMLHEDKIVIIDENTGRAQPGRRFSDGLHQAIEAKEGAAIQQETQTYATVTLQNFFRMYGKLSGMTGTAITEAHEFKEIYKLDVLEIPTNRPCQRKDHNDLVYMTEREKYIALLKEVDKVHKEGRPILLGTESVDVSEKLSRVLRQARLPHTVLNAKHHDREAEIIAQAGQKGAITIATSMAGRGTDIKLGEGIAKLGGLAVIGASRHQSRRIDRQLRGRCARQGDPGSSLFFISFEDQLMRLFASPRLSGLLKRLRPPEGEPISAGILNRSIETAQKRVEQRNYTMRKHTVEYDDVMNKQRQEVYAFRNEILHSTDVLEIARDIIADVVLSAPDHEWLLTHFPVSIEPDDDLEQTILPRALEALDQKITAEADNPDIAKEAIRSLMTRSIDTLWQQHLLSMDHLRSDVGMQTVGQKDPLQEFKSEAFHLFSALGNQLREKIAGDLFRFQIVSPTSGYLQALLGRMQMNTQHPLSLEEQPSRVQRALQQQPTPPSSSTPVAGRNDPCPCGSGKKFKRCCGETAPHS
jgi:preprotein translocase subunit SecA